MNNLKEYRPLIVGLIGSPAKMAILHWLTDTCMFAAGFDTEMTTVEALKI